MLCKLILSRLLIVMFAPQVNSTLQLSERWKEVLVPTTGRHPVADIHFEQQVTLRGLTPATAYDLRIQAQNKHGWNRVSDTFHFSTIGRGGSFHISTIGRGGSFHFSTIGRGGSFHFSTIGRGGSISLICD